MKKSLLLSKNDKVKNSMLKPVGYFSSIIEVLFSMIVQYFITLAIKHYSWLSFRAQFLTALCGQIIWNKNEKGGDFKMRETDSSER